MNNEFSTIDTNELDSVNGGNRGQAIKKAGQWAWRNVIAPMGGGQQPPAQQPPAQQPPAKP